MDYPPNEINEFDILFDMLTFTKLESRYTGTLYIGIGSFYFIE